MVKVGTQVETGNTLHIQDAADVVALVGQTGAATAVYLSGGQVVHVQESIEQIQGNLD